MSYFYSGSYRWRAGVVAVLLAVLYCSTYMDRALIFLFVDLIKSELRVSDTQIGLIEGTPFVVANLVFAVPFGMVCDRFNRRNFLLICSVILAMTTLACAAVPSFALLVVCFLVIGAADAAHLPVTYSMLGDILPRGRRAFGMTVFFLAVSLGSGAVVGLAGKLGSPDWLEAAGFHVSLSRWRIGYVGSGLLGCMGVLAVLLIREPQRAQFEGSERRAGGAASSMWHFAREHGVSMLLLIVMVVAVKAIMGSFLAWMPAVLQRVYGLEVAPTAALFGSLTAVGGLSGTATAGFMSTRFGGAWVGPAKVASACLLIAVGFSSSLVLHLAHISLLATIIGLSISICGAATAVPIAIQEAIPTAFKGRFAGAVSLANATGSALGPTLVGLCSDRLFGVAHVNSSLALTSATLALGGVIAGSALVLRFRHDPKLGLSNWSAGESEPARP